MDTTRDMANKRTFGDLIRLTREELNMSVRELAHDLGISESFLRDIEARKTAPADDRVIVEISEILGLDLNELMALAGKFGSYSARYLKNHPTLRKIVLWAVDRDLTERELKRLLEHVDEFKRDQ